MIRLLLVLVALAGPSHAWAQAAGRASAPAASKPAPAANTPAPAEHAPATPAPPAGAANRTAGKPATKGNTTLSLDPKLADVTPVKPGSRQQAKSAATTDGPDVEMVVARINQRLREAEDRRRRARTAPTRTQVTARVAPPAPLPPFQRVSLTWRIPLTWPDFETPQ